MQRLIPLIYFYVVSLGGLVILIIGIFADVHFLVNKFSYSQYPLPYDVSQRCIFPGPIPLMKGAPSVPTSTIPVQITPVEAGQVQAMPVQVKTNTGSSPTAAPMPMPNIYYYNNNYNDCLQQVAQERKQTEVQDLEKAVSFTLVGLLVFGIHFYFARKKSIA